MRNLGIFFLLIVFNFGLAGAAAGKQKKGAVSGTWACVAHGTGQGDIPYTLNLTEARGKVTGSFAATASGENAEISDGSFKAKKLDLHFDAYGGPASITGTVTKKGEMSGTWTHSSGGQGTWDCKRSATAASK